MMMKVMILMLMALTLVRLVFRDCLFDVMAIVDDNNYYDDELIIMAA